MPPLAAMLEDVGNPTAAHLGAFLGVSPRTVARWLARGHAPRPASLALFWLTRWGRSQVDCTAVNDARLWHAVAQAQTTRAAQLAAALDALEKAPAAPARVILSVVGSRE
jgi:hypothetical protein